MRFDGVGGAWTQRHRQWLTAVDLGQSGAQVTLLDYLGAIDALLVRRDTLDRPVDVGSAWCRQQFGVPETLASH